MKTAFEDGSGDDLYAVEGDARVAGDMPEDSPTYCVACSLLRGGEYGGGAGVTTEHFISQRPKSRA